MIALHTRENMNRYAASYINIRGKANKDLREYRLEVPIHFTVGDAAVVWDANPFKSLAMKEDASRNATKR